MKFVKSISIIGLIFISLIFILYLLGYRYNHSTSYPKGIYQLTKQQISYEKGQLVLFCPPNNATLQLALNRKYLEYGICNGGFEPVIKKVFGTPDDIISFTDGVINVNYHPIKNTTVLDHDSMGRYLPHLADFVVPSNSYFLLSDHKPKVSFDSRYYGSVPIDNIKGLVIPIYIF
ncbi:conjugative transfer signal peptidase TraF [Photobacterium damselae]|uniref:conjugative transfer signal peptidase TraF n=1 Tax=Photobacterium damselae TaxID=38293 RepID=UPI0010FDAF62|nr:conjugative transfer signal peptidase TraF [Photobacterium damselae]KAB1511995.1 conjugative transfer signal peptidase TraF [Photobacterium damselae subsp. damselae]TLS69575.1 conjugative transfer signal peptidase TraF [Photobacterium damselae subsp. damselae]TLS74569.1 conjugative transfer signal peptidase TraF [Photobacterium damselae subsp. damselae]TLS84132.1 conjugative transfer signal peptidase TraF [Photobacterium damselae subsp. damselae]